MKSYFKFFLLLLGIATIIIACVEENPIEESNLLIDSSPLKQVSDWHYMGDAHNEYLSAVCRDFDGHKITSKEDALDYFTSFLSNFSPTNEALSSQLGNSSGDKLKSAFEVALDDWTLLEPNQLIEKALEQSTQDALAIGVSNELIDNFEKEIITDFLLLANENYSFEELNTFIDEKTILWEAQGYTENDQFGTFSAILLAVSKRSTEWWLENPNCLPQDGARWVFLARDAVGLAVGCGLCCLAHDVNGGSTQESNGLILVASTVSASTGLIGVGAKVIKNFWP